MNNIKLSVITVGVLLLSNGVNAIEMTDYTVADSYYQDAYLNGKASVDSGNQEQTSYDMHLNANLKTVRTTLPYSWDFKVDVNSDFSQGKNDEDKSKDSYDSTASAHFDKYINNDDKIFLYGSGNLGYRKTVNADNADDLFAKVGVGAGYGRVYNATPLAKALRIVEDLLKYKLIKKDISDKAYLALAKVIDKQLEYESKHGSVEFKKYWYEDMEKVLKDDGATDKESLGAFGIVRINEILDVEKVSNRIHGWKVRAGFGKVLSSYDGDSQDPTVDAEFEYGLPIGHEAQFSENLLVSKLLDNDSDTELIATNTMSYTYEISDMIDWENSWILSFEQHDVEDDIVGNSLSTGFRYYLANRLSFDTTISISKVDGGKNEEKAWNKSLFAGVTYRLK